MRPVILALLLSAVAWAQPVNPPPAILKGNPPGGPGGACVASNLIGYLTSTGTQYLCPSGTSVWTAVVSGGGSTPTGPAGGALSGTYPNPDVANPLPTTSMSATGILQVGAAVTTTPFVNPFSTATFTYAGNGGEFIGSGLNDMSLATITSGYTGAAPAAFIVKINSTGTPDTIVWAKNNGSFSSPVNIAGVNTPQTLGTEGLKVQFGATTGHTAGDYWVVPTLAGALWPSTVSETGQSGASAALAGAGAGSVTNGVHSFKTTWVTSTGETYAASAGSATVANNAVNGKISITSIPQSSSALALGTNIWATKAGGSTYYLAAFVPKGTTSYTFNTADSALTHAAPAYWDNVTTAGGCVYGEDAGLNFGSCPLQFFDYGLRFPLGGAGRQGAYFFDGFPDGILGTSGNYLTQLTALPSATTATTQSSHDNSTKIATTAYVDAAAGGGGGMVLIEQHAASTSAALNFTTCITSTYDTYVIELVNLIPAGSTTDLLLQFSANGGGAYDTGANYGWARWGWRYSASAAAGGTGQTAISLFNSATMDTSTANGGVTGTWHIYSPLSTTMNKQGYGSTAAVDGSGILANSMSGTYYSTAAQNAFRILFGAGNITSGTARCYGLAK